MRQCKNSGRSPRAEGCGGHVQTLNSAVSEAIAVIEVSSLALGFRALDLVTQEQGLEILEAAAHGPKIFTLLVRGDKSQLETAVRKVSSSISSTGDSTLRDSIVIDQLNPQIIETYFSLHTTEMTEALLVVECETLSGLFQAAQVATSDHKLTSIEIRNLRGDNPVALGLFTGTYKACVDASEGIRHTLANQARSGVVEAINNPSKSFRHFFNL